MSYRGLFVEADARRHAEKLRSRGLRRVRRRRAGLFDARLVRRPAAFDLHPLSRTRSSRGCCSTSSRTRSSTSRDDTTFNESFAVAVEEEGVRRWLRGARPPKSELAYVQRGAERAGASSQRGSMQCASASTAVYKSDIPEEEKRGIKAREFDALRAEYRRCRAGGAEQRLPRLDRGVYRAGAGVRARCSPRPAATCPRSTAG